MTKTSQEKYYERGEKYAERGFSRDMAFLTKGAKNNLRYYQKKWEKNPNAQSNLRPSIPEMTGQVRIDSGSTFRKQFDSGRVLSTSRKARGQVVGTSLFDRGRVYWGK